MDEYLYDPHKIQFMLSLGHITKNLPLALGIMT
jgi:hypothetical protein